MQVHLGGNVKGDAGQKEQRTHFVGLEKNDTPVKPQTGIIQSQRRSSNVGGIWHRPGASSKLMGLIRTHSEGGLQFLVGPLCLTISQTGVELGSSVQGNVTRDSV